MYSDFTRYFILSLLLIPQGSVDSRAKISIRAACFPDFCLQSQSQLRNRKNSLCHTIRCVPFDMRNVGQEKVQILMVVGC